MRTTSAVRTTTKAVSLARDPAVLGPPMVHPGEMLMEEFVRPMGLQVAFNTGIPAKGRARRTA